MSNQLVKKNPAEGYQNVFPKTWIDAIKDKESGVSLQEILQGFNMYFLSYNGSRALTRCKVPSILRKEGLWITYVLYDHTVVTEWYNSDQIDDNSWSMDSNWRIASNNLVGDISVSSDGYWVINGEKTDAKAQGEQGVTPLLRVGANSKLQVSYNAGKAWKDISDYIIPRFRWNQGVGTTAGTIQISMDLGKTWTNLSNEITNNLRISRYIDINESLPTSGVAEGTIYMKGPYYNESDTSNTNPIYRMWVYAWKGNTLAWQDNGEFTSISAGVVQERGNSTTKVMSQYAITRELTKLESQVIYDVSANNNGETFDSLPALLSSENLSTLIPVAVRCGGMSIRFVQTSDNKYVQYRLMNDKFSTTESDWQGVDNEPELGSNNIVKSGGVAYNNEESIAEIFKSVNLIDASLLVDGYVNGGRYYTSDTYCCTPFIVLKPNTTYYICAKATTSGDARFVNLFDKNGKFLRELTYTNAFTTANNEYLVRASFNKNNLYYWLVESNSAEDYVPYKKELDGVLLRDNSINRAKIENKIVNVDKLDDILKNSNIGLLFQNGFSVLKSSVGTYTQITSELPSNIPVGTILYNHGVELILGDTPSLGNRYDIRSNSLWVATFEVGFVQTKNTAGNVNLEIIGSGISKLIANGLKEGAVSPDAITIDVLDKIVDFSGNFINGVPYAGYLNPNGTITSHSSYSTTEYIRVKSEQTYSISSFFELLEYDVNKTPIILRTSYSEQFTTNKNTAYVRITIANADINTAIMNEGSELQDYVPYSRKIKYKYLPETIIKDYSIDLKKLDFVNSSNLVDKNDPGVAIGYYIDNRGNLQQNATYNTTGFIRVKPNTMYALHASQGPTVRFVNTYDINKNVIEQSEPSDNITTGENIYWLRITYYASNWQYAQVTEGADILSYRDYLLVIPQSVIEPALAEEVVFFLPKHIYVAEGRTIELYYEQMCLNAHKYNIRAQCSIGKNLDRKFQIIGDSQHIGNNYTLTIEVLNDSMNILASGTSTIHVVSNTISTDKYVVPIGDSLTNNKPWLDELVTLSNSKLHTVGTWQYYPGKNHEGRSGATVGFYNSISLTELNTFANGSGYKGLGYDSLEFSDSTHYAIGDTCWKTVNSKKVFYVFTSAHNGAWSDSDVFNLSQTNPFLDYQTGEWSISAYKTRNSISYDAIIIFLGTNGLSLTPETNPNGALGIKTLIDNIREEEADTPIIVINTIFRSSQNGIGNQGNTDGYSAQSTYKFLEDKKVLLLAKSLQDMIGNYSNVYLCPCGFTMDSKYDFGDTKVQVNPRIESTDVVYELMPSDSVHPQESGYMQIADEMFSTLCAVFNT